MINYALMRRRFPTIRVAPSEAIIKFDDRWGQFQNNLPPTAALARMDDASLSEAIGTPAWTLTDAVPAALRQWRISPSQSLINVVANIPQDLPEGGMFKGIFQQTRVLFSAVFADALPVTHLRAIVDEDGNRHMVAQDAQAVTLTDEGAAVANDIARAFRAWELRNRARMTEGLVKAPSKLYRGIRSGTIEAEFIRGPGEKYEIARSRLIERQLQRLTTEPLRDVSNAPLLSWFSLPAPA